MRQLFSSLLLATVGLAHAVPEECPVVLGLGVLVQTTETELLHRFKDMGCGAFHYRVDQKSAPF